MAALNTLPNELLSLIASHLDHPKDILCLALCSHRLHSFVTLSGWKAFLRGRFDVRNLDSDARTSVHGLTTLHRSWDRKAFLARFLNAPSHTTSLNSWCKDPWTEQQQQHHARGQTMGYQPSIDSYEEMNGKWVDRREVLAWSAGTKIVLRVRDTGSKADTYTYEKGDADSELARELDHFQNLNTWYTYKIPDSAEGLDDITSMKLLRPHHHAAPGAEEHAVFGTASGRLSLLSANLDAQETREQSYETNRRPVNSLSISPHSEPMIAAALGDSSLALYPISTISSAEATSTPHEVLSEVSPHQTQPRPGRIWSCNFISASTVALGMGPSYEPIQLFSLTPTGFHPSPLRRFTLDSPHWSEHTGSTLSAQQQRSSTSIYPVVPVPDASGAVPHSNSVFLSGGYDGMVRLHDVRSRRGFDALFWDVSNDAAIYSLACQGAQRFVVGSSMHSMLKVFDLRFPGARPYHYLPTAYSTAAETHRSDRVSCDADDEDEDPITHTGGGWNIFLNPRHRSNPTPDANSANPQRRPHRIPDSPLYSLSIPSPLSLHIYAGLEGAVQCLTFASASDAHPDPLLSRRFSSSLDARLGGLDLNGDNGANAEAKRLWDPRGDVLNLGMYEQGGEGEELGMRLKVQRGVGAGTSSAPKKNEQKLSDAPLDARWMDARDEVEERWVRGGENPAAAGRRNTAGGGRGRTGGRRTGRGRGGGGGGSGGGSGAGGH